VIVWRITVQLAFSPNTNRLNQYPNRVVLDLTHFRGDFLPFDTELALVAHRTTGPAVVTANLSPAAVFELQRVLHSKMFMNQKLKRATAHAAADAWVAGLQHRPASGRTT
jgi:hypothetical protein